MKKQRLLITLTVCAIFSLYSCGNNTPTTIAERQETELDKRQETEIDNNNLDSTLSLDVPVSPNEDSDSVLGEEEMEKRGNITEKVASSENSSEINDMSDSEKLEICNYIQWYYSYYDLMFGGYSGDKYTDQIWTKAAAKYNLDEEDISIIWSKGYSYGSQQTPESFRFQRVVDRDEKTYYSKCLSISLADNTARLQSILRSKSSKHEGGYINSLNVFNLKTIRWNDLGQGTVYADDGKRYVFQLDEYGAMLDISGEDSLDLAGYYELIEEIP